MGQATIAAIATPVAPGGIGIVRLSGPRAVEIALLVFQRHRDKLAGKALTAEAMASHRVYHGYVFDDTALVDEVLLVVMKGPRSYTGEDVAEIHAHGGPMVVGTICDLVLKNGAVSAEPGEFTRRAFLNGRIDLTQAEAVADMIEAASTEQVRAAAAQLTGRIRQEVGSVKQSLMDLLSEMEAITDFEDHVGNIFDPARAAQLLSNSVLPGLEDLISRNLEAESFRAGVGVVIAGRPNAGKSTLLNRLLGQDRAIVSDAPGTTRDLVDGRVWLAGMPFVFTDTAGIGRAAGDDVEAMGMERAHQALARADMVLFVVDATAGVSPAEQAVIDRVSTKPCIVAANKSDLPGAAGVVMPAAWAGGVSAVRISALYGQGINELKALLAGMARERVSARGPGGTFNPRHRATLAACRQATINAMEGLKSGTPVDMVAMDVREALRNLGEMTGEGAGQEVLDAVFGRFCIGK